LLPSTVASNRTEHAETMPSTEAMLDAVLRAAA
jgi:hypothetical protein